MGASPLVRSLIYYILAGVSSSSSTTLMTSHASQFTNSTTLVSTQTAQPTTQALLSWSHNYSTYHGRGRDNNYRGRERQTSTATHARLRLYSVSYVMDAATPLVTVITLLNLCHFHSLRCTLCLHRTLYLCHSPLCLTASRLHSHHYALLFFIFW